MVIRWNETCNFCTTCYDWICISTGFLWHSISNPNKTQCTTGQTGRELHTHTLTSNNQLCSVPNNLEGISERTPWPRMRYECHGGSEKDWRCQGGQGGGSPAETTRGARPLQHNDGGGLSWGLTCVIYVSRHRGFEPLITWNESVLSSSIALSHFKIGGS